MISSVPSEDLSPPQVDIDLRVATRADLGPWDPLMSRRSLMRDIKALCCANDDSRVRTILNNSGLVQPVVQLLQQRGIVL